MPQQQVLPSAASPAVTSKPLHEVTISRLSNAIYYFLECVYLLASEQTVRLVVIKGNRVLVDEIYESYRGARIAFARMYKNKAWCEEVKPDWSDFYSPDPQWMETYESVQA